MRIETESGPRISVATARAGYLPTLDGWRAIATLAVIFFHDRHYSFGPVGTGWLFEHGNNGVDLFFAISGLLICWRLLEEEKAFGEISLRNFYIRRAFRILPPALMFLGAVGILSLMGVFQIGLREWLGALFFFHNYSSLLGHLGMDSIFLDHFWSLAVEEHFYLILPATLALTRNRFRITALVSMTLLTEVHRLYVLQSRTWIFVGHHTDVCLDYLMIPALLAVIAQSRKVRERLTRWLRVWPLLLIAVVVLIIGWSGSLWQVTASAILMPMMLLGSVLNPHGYLARALEWPPLLYLGRISYSIYLWQELFFIGHFYRGVFPLGNLERTPLRFAATLALAMASYHFVERPLIKVGHRLAPPASPGRGDISDGVERIVSKNTLIAKNASTWRARGDR